MGGGLSRPGKQMVSVPPRGRNTAKVNDFQSGPGPGSKRQFIPLEVCQPHLRVKIHNEATGVLTETEAICSRDLGGVQDEANGNLPVSGLTLDPSICLGCKFAESG
jgi:hypothetical protein